jgi:hypothetical protein
MVPPTADVLIVPQYKDSDSVRHYQIKKNAPRITAKDIQPQIYTDRKENYLDINSLSNAFQPYRIM